MLAILFRPHCVDVVVAMGSLVYQGAMSQTVDELIVETLWKKNI